MPITVETSAVVEQVADSPLNTPHTLSPPAPCETEIYVKAHNPVVEAQTMNASCEEHHEVCSTLSYDFPCCFDLPFLFFGVPGMSAIRPVLGPNLFTEQSPPSA